MKGSRGEASAVYCSAISPTAQAALLHTETQSTCGSITICSMTDGMIVGTTGLSKAKQEIAMSPRSAWADCLTGGS